MMREQVLAEVVWIATIGHLDMEGRGIQSRDSTEHDTEGDARRYLVGCGLSEPAKRTIWGGSWTWEDDGAYRIGSITRPIFAWYDLWVGAFWDQAKRRLYVLPLPCVGIVIDFARPHDTPERASVLIGASGRRRSASGGEG